MAITQTGAACPALLVGLNEINPQQAELVTPVGFLQAMFDPANRRDGSVITDNGTVEPGQPRPVRVAHKVRSTPASVETAKSCGNGVERPYLEETFNTTLYREQSFKVSEEALRVLCSAHSDWVKFGQSNNAQGQATALQAMREVVTEFMLDVDSLRQSINDACITQYAAKVGKWKGGAVTKSFPVYRTTATTGLESGGVIPAGFNTFRQEVMQSTFRGTPLVFGNGNMYLATQSMGYGCCNSAGVDISAMNAAAGYKFYSDLNAGTILGGVNNFGMFMPGSVQFASYNEYVGKFSRPIGKMERGTMMDPFVPGLVYDVRILPNECGEYYEMIVGLHFDVWVSPLTEFSASDALYEVNGAFNAVATAV